MRIAFDSQIFTTQSYGGISRYISRLSKNIRLMGECVQLFAPFHINSYLSELPSEIVLGMRFERFPPKTTRIFSLCNELISRYQIADWKPDVVHETYYSRRTVAPVNCPVVLTVHDMIHELHADKFSEHDKTAEIKKIAIERADHVICVSENTKNDLMNLYGTSANKISVVLLGFDQLYQYENLPSISKAKIKPFLLYVGSRGGYKNFIGFLDAFVASRKLMSDFNIIAFGGSKFTSDELVLIKAKGFSEGQVCHVTGNDEILGMYYKAARAFIYPSLYEGFGIPPLEAMANRCPVISSNTSSMPEVIGDAGEYFVPENTEDMRRAIESVVYSESRICNLKELGVARLTNFSWSKCSQETMKIYRTIS